MFTIFKLEANTRSTQTNTQKSMKTLLFTIIMEIWMNKGKGRKWHLDTLNRQFEAQSKTAKGGRDTQFCIAPFSSKAIQSALHQTSVKTQDTQHLDTEY